jgi:outer membrane lipoprotein-sorting protein
MGSRCAATAVLATVACAFALASQRHKGEPLDLKQILAQMNENGKRLKTVSGNFEYTKVTVLVDDRSTETGQLFLRKGKPPELLLKFEKPDQKVILLKKNKAEMFNPKINQIQEYDLEKHSGLVDQFLLLGFGTESDELKKAYNIKYLNEENLGGDLAALLELTPRSSSVANQISKIQLWISEESWLPTQQKFFEPSGDYLLTRFSSVKFNIKIPSSTFRIDAPDDAKRVKME